MKFRLVESLIESELGNENRRLINAAAKKVKQYFMSLSEEEMIKAVFNKNNQEKITDHSSMYITSNGHILNATYYMNTFFDVEDQVHLDIFFLKFISLMKKELKGTSAEHLINKRTIYLKVVNKLFNIQDYCMKKFNWIKINSGTVTDDNNCYIALNGIIYDAQMSIIKDYLWSIYEWDHEQVQIWATNGDQLYSLDSPDDINYVIERLELYNRIGVLKESTEQINYNANPRGKNEGDCTIRALSLAYDLRYNNVKSELNSIARQNNSEFNELNTIKAFIDKHGCQNYINNETSGSAIDDVDDFAGKNRNGIFVIYCTNKTKQDTSNSFHLVTIINGKIYDTWDPSKYYVIGAWKIKSGNYNRTVNSISQQEGE